MGMYPPGCKGRGDADPRPAEICGGVETEESGRFPAPGYITGILPIRKIEGKSAPYNLTK